MAEYPVSYYFLNLFNFQVEILNGGESENQTFQIFHIQNVTKILLILEIFIIIPIYILFLAPWWIFWIGVHFALILVTIYGIARRNHLFLWPIVVVAALQFLTWSTLTFFQFLVLAFSTETFLEFYSQQFHEGFFEKAIAVIVIKTISLLIGLFFFWRLTVFYRCKKYFFERKERQPVSTENELKLVEEPEKPNEIEV
ncbi:unnamed protein product [Caenorhabditis angaria]|uniref:Uncharacterized protein n=1 Tax=Caenorhabditis angaria TaxID=860376 RepID=A0A9P1I8B5_9PELO|nr:unnamed protein product [Caenorhabditis angaria]